MGQVFTWKAIQKGKIPTLDNFRLVIEGLRHNAPSENSILGLLVFGSVVRNDHTIRSDLDCFVLYDVLREHEAFKFMQRETEFAKTFHVPLGFVPCDSLIARTRMHHVGGSFRRHMEKSIAAGGLLKGDPLAVLDDSLTEREELESYLRVKLYNLQEAWAASPTFSKERRATYLKKLLEAPLHIARKTLACMGMLSQDSKAFIRSEYIAKFPGAMADGLESLIALDASYTEHLLLQIDNPDLRAYETFLQGMMDSSEEVLAFIRSNLAYVAKTAR